MSKDSTESKKITLNVVIDGGKVFTEEFTLKQKVQVVINKATAHFKLQGDAERSLKRDSTGDILKEYAITLEELGFRDGETLRYILLSAPKPEEPKKFA